MVGVTTFTPGMPCAPVVTVVVAPPVVIFCVAAAAAAKAAMPLIWPPDVLVGACKRTMHHFIL